MVHLQPHRRLQVLALALRKFIRVLSSGVLYALLLAVCSGCYTTMDPYKDKEEEGVRFNMNGRKFIMITHLDGYAAELVTPEQPCTFRSSAQMKPADGFPVEGGTIYFDITDDKGLVEGQKYYVGSESKRIQFSFWDNDIRRTVVLRGWITFLKLGYFIEARFELDGQFSYDDKCEIHHGFLRLQQREKEEL